MEPDETKRREICDARVREGLEILNGAGLVDVGQSPPEMQRDYVLNVVRALLGVADHMMAVQHALGLVHQDLTPDERIHLLNATVARIFDLQDIDPPQGKPN